MLTIPTRRILIFGFLAFVLIGLEQGILGLFVAELGAQLRRSPEELGSVLCSSRRRLRHRHGLRTHRLARKTK